MDKKPINAAPAEAIPLIHEWLGLKASLTPIKATVDFEKKTRATVAEKLAPGSPEGLQHFQCPCGCKVVISVTIPYTRSVDVAAVNAIQEQLTARKISADKLVRWKPELELEAFRELTAEDQAIFAQALITKPGAPQVTIKEPEGK